MNDNIDWNTFKFPPRPPKKWSEDTEEKGQAPNWASPPQTIKTWKLDTDKMVIIHPVLRKKIDLSRVNSHTRLIQLCQIIKKQKPLDGFALWVALDNACIHAWGYSLPEILAKSPQHFLWPKTDDFTDIDE